MPNDRNGGFNISYYLDLRSLLIMKRKILFSIVLFAAVISLAGIETYGFERCIMCGMDADKSETKYIVVVEKGSKELKKGDYGLCCLHCLVLLRKNLEARGGTMGSILTMDYNTKEMTDARKAFYLIESELIPKGSMVPFMLAFKDQGTAETFKKVYGGIILNWEKTVKYVIEYKY